MYIHQIAKAENRRTPLTPERRLFLVQPFCKRTGMPPATLPLPRNGASMKPCGAPRRRSLPQYGESSDQLQSLGLKKKTEYKRSAREKKSKPA